jgi:predicted AAA+ superfamily ATPase
MVIYQYLCLFYRVRRALQVAQDQSLGWLLWLWDDLWVRGGFPQSLTALSDAHSVLWRHDFTRAYLECDVA